MHMVKGRGVFQWRISSYWCQAVPEYRSTDGHACQGQTNRGAGWHNALPPPLPGSWKDDGPTDQQLLGLWLSDWSGCCAPPGSHSGHLTLGKLTHAWPLGAPAEGCDPEGVMTLLHWSHMCVLMATLWICLMFAGAIFFFCEHLTEHRVLHSPTVLMPFDLLSWWWHGYSKSACTHDRVPSFVPRWHVVIMWVSEFLTVESHNMDNNTGDRGFVWLLPY